MGNESKYKALGFVNLANEVTVGVNLRSQQNGSTKYQAAHRTALTSPLESVFCVTNEDAESPICDPLGWTVA